MEKSLQRVVSFIIASIIGITVLCAPMPNGFLIDIASMVGAESVYGDFSFELNNNEITITKYNGDDSNVIVPDFINGCTVTSIGNNAFRSCSSIISLTLPDEIHNIGSYAFYGCSALKHIRLPQKLEVLGGEYVFGGCSSLVSLFIPESVRSIGYMIFEGCDELTVINIPEDTEWGYYSFRQKGTPYRMHIHIPYGKQAKNYWVDGASGLPSNSDFYYELDEHGNCPDPNCIANAKAERHSNNDFRYIICDTHVVLEKYIGNSTEINVPSELEGKKVVSIEPYCFSECEKINTIHIPDSINNIGKYAFNGCTDLVSVNIPAGISSIKNSTFRSCSSISSIDLPDSIRTIEAHAFDGCMSLKDMIIPEGVDSLKGEYTFGGCSSLEYVLLPESCKELGYMIFEGCNSLVCINIPENMSFGYYSFRQKDKVSKMHIHIPYGKQARNYWVDGSSGLPSVREFYYPLDQNGFCSDPNCPIESYYSDKFGDGIYFEKSVYGKPELYYLTDRSSFIAKSINVDIGWMYRNKCDNSVNFNNKYSRYSLLVEAPDGFSLSDDKDEKIRMFDVSILDATHISSNITLYPKRYKGEQNQIRCVLFCDDIETARTTQNISILRIDDTSDFLKFKTNYYKTFTGFSSYEEAAQYCISVGGHLATVTSKEENDAISEFLDGKGLNQVYVGLRRNGDSFYWLTGDELSYTNWHTGEPNTLEELYGMIYTGGTWNDARWNGTKAVVLCEWDGSETNTVKLSLTEEQKAEMKTYTRQHYYSSIPRYWNRFHEVKDTMNCYDNNTWTESGHATVIGLNGAVDVVTFNVDGIVKQVSSNAYNAILLDMYYKLGQNDDEFLEALHENAVLKAIKKYTDVLFDSVKQIDNVDSNLLAINRNAFMTDLYNSYYNPDSAETVDTLTKKYGLRYIGKEEGYVKNEDIVLKGTMDSDKYGYPVGDLYSDINTVNKLFANYHAIILGLSLIDMNEQYREILLEIRLKAITKKCQGYDWEIDDLVNAIDYEVGFRENYVCNLTLAQAWELYNSLTSISKLKDFGTKHVLDDVSEKLIDKIWKSNPAKATTIKGNIHAIQLGTKIGWALSDEMFNLKNATDLYYKGKAYGVLEDILCEMLDVQAGKLSYQEDYTGLCDDEIREMYKEADIYDTLFRMYVYVESEGCKTYANYEKSHVIDSDDNYVEQFFGSLGLSTEYLVRMVGNSVIDFLAVTIVPLFGDTNYDISTLDPHYQSVVQLQQKYAQRNFNIAYYTHRADFIKSKIKCHGSEFDTKEGTMAYFQSVSDAYLAIIKEEYDLAMVMCPVEVNVYDENRDLVGTISSKRNTLPEDSQVVFAFRNEVNDANIIIYPENYSIETVSYDNGEMTIWGAHCGEQEIDRIVGYVKMDISDDYVGEFEISAEEDHLTRMPSTKCTLSSIKVNNEEIADFDSEIPEYTIELPEGTTEIPVVTADPSNEKAKVTVEQAKALTGEESSRTATITVVAEDGEHNTVYKVTFTVAEHQHTLDEEYTSDETGHWHACSGCDEKVDFSEHTEDNGTVTKAATEDEEGEMTYKCTICGYVTRTEPIDKLPHTHKTTDAWASDETGHWHACSGCEEKVDFAKHTEDNGIITKTATEYEEGETAYKCTICNYVTRTEPISKLPHTHKKATEYSSDATGHWFACSECDEKIDFHTHTEDDGTTTIEPTETTTGEKVFKCTECGYTTRTEVLAVLPHTHSISDVWTSDATGHWHKCSGCDEKVDFSTHTEDEGTVTIEPTEEAEGERTFRCTVCGHITRTETIDKLPHTHKITDEWTSDSTGHWRTCSGCEEKVDFSAHTEDVGEVTTQPTEQTEGVKTYRCTECGYIIRTEMIGKLVVLPAKPTTVIKIAFGGRTVQFNCDDTDAEIYYQFGSSNITKSCKHDKAGETIFLDEPMTGNRAAMYFKAYKNGKWSVLGKWGVLNVQIAKPLITQSGKASENNFKVYTQTKDSYIVYTLDGTIPSIEEGTQKLKVKNGKLIWGTQGNINVPYGCTVKAIAIRCGLVTSDVMTYTNR